MWTTVALIAVASMIVASLMEIIKYKVYDNEAKQKKMVLLGLLFSVLITPVIYFGFDMMGKPIAMILYMIGIYIIQKQLNMKAIRPIIKSVIQKKLESL